MGITRWIRGDATIKEEVVSGEESEFEAVGYFQKFGVTADTWDEACALVRDYMLGDVAASILALEDFGPVDFQNGDPFFQRFQRRSRLSGIWYVSGRAFYGSEEDDDDEDSDDPLLPIDLRDAELMIDSGEPDKVHEALERLIAQGADYDFVVSQCFTLLGSANSQVVDVAAYAVCQTIKSADYSEYMRMRLFKRVLESDVSAEVKEFVNSEVLNSHAVGVDPFLGH